MEEKFRTKYMKFRGETEAWWIDGILEDINKFLNKKMKKKKKKNV